MDPNANLQEQSTCTDPARLRELRQALLAWLTSGGFEPEWVKYQCATNDFQAWRANHAPIGTIETTWEVWTYDVWGNARDGYEVNDRYCHDRAYKLTLPIEINNPGTPRVFQSAYPTDKQIRAAFGIRCRYETDGDDLTIYVTRERDGYPIGEMVCTSHESLSPIQTRRRGR